VPDTTIAMVMQIHGTAPARHPKTNGHHVTTSRPWFMRSIKRPKRIIAALTANNPISA